MSFDVSADAYTQFMGRYSRPLSTAFANLVQVPPDARALDVGCGPGALTTELLTRVGASQLRAVDPSQPFVDAMRREFPDVEVARASAEHLPYADATFDLTLAQLVVHFMTDPVAGLREMARVTVPGGIAAANVWDHGGGHGPLSPFWQAVRKIDPASQGESQLAGVEEGKLVALFESAGMTHASSTSLSVQVHHPTFEEWWHPFTLGVGPAGDYVAQLDVAKREELRRQCERTLPRPPFTLEAVAWTVQWRKPT